MNYMRIMLFSLIPFGVGQAYSSAISECGHTKIPMLSSMIALVVNVLLDYCLIFGNLGFKEMGIESRRLEEWYFVRNPWENT